jgi:hypothetical protein
MFKFQLKLGCSSCSCNLDVQLSVGTWMFEFQLKLGCSSFSSNLGVQVSNQT